MGDFNEVTVSNLIHLVSKYAGINEYVVCINTPEAENYFSEDKVSVDDINKKLIIDISGDYDER